MRALTTTSLAVLAAAGLSGAAAAEIRIGASVSETGPAAFLGDPEARTLEMMVEDLNAAGAINGEEVALTLYDDGGDPNKARTFATRLIEERGVKTINYRRLAKAAEVLGVRPREVLGGDDVDDELMHHLDVLRGLDPDDRREVIEYALYRARPRNGPE